jgi:lysophospholipid hydrolase
MQTPQVEIDALVAFLKTTAIFAPIPEEALQVIAPQLEQRSYAPNGQVIAEGDPGASLFIVWRGQLRAVLDKPDGSEAFLNNIEPGGSVGEIALITGERRTASVYANEPSELLELHRDQLAWLVEHHPLEAAAVNQAIIRRLMRSQLNLALHRSKLFEGLDTAVMHELRDEFDLRLLRGGETLVRQGEQSDDLYLIVNGRLRVVAEQTGNTTTTLYELRRGQSVGEAGIITGQPSNATVYAVRDSLLAKLSRASFHKLLVAHPQVIMQQFAAPLIRLLGEQTNTAHRADNEITTLALVGVDPRRPIGEFAAQLTSALSTAGSTLLLSSDGVDTLLSRPGAAQTPAESPASFSLVRWLNDQENNHRYIVYQTDQGITDWTKRCLRQADRIILVGDMSDSPEQGPIERTLLSDEDRQRGARRSLVLVHAPDTRRPRGANRWLDARRIDSHYHVRQGNPADMARLGRLLTGRAVGVVLSGGGAPGFGHIGALRALREAGIPIDLIGGTSQGGLISCQYAMGWDFETIMAKNHAAIRHRFDYTFPVTAMMAGGEMSLAVKELFEDAQLEDMWIPCFCVTVSLSRAAMVVHERGPTWKYTRATTSLPGVLPPVMDGNDMLVDGGILNNLPADVMRRRDDCGIVIAIDASSDADSAQAQLTPYETSLSGWRVLWSRINPFGQRLHVPTMGNIMVRVAVLNDVQKLQQNRNLADYYIKLPEGKYGLLEFQAIDEIVEASYRSITSQLACYTGDPAFQALLEDPHQFEAHDQ